MGIRINSAIAFGVQFTAKEARLYERFMKDKPRYFLFMRWVEAVLERENKGCDDQDCYQAFKFAKFNRKTKKPLKPYRPFWQGMSKKNLEKLTKGYLWDMAEDNLKAAGRESEWTDESMFRLWEPDNDGEVKPKRILAFVNERNYARDVDYGLVDYFKMEDCKDFIIPLKGRRPWECGTTRDRQVKNRWYTLNGENMIPRRFLPKGGEGGKVLQQILWYTGKRSDYIKLKKEIWDKYHRRMKPYMTYACDGWHGADFYFGPPDLLFRIISKMIPGIKYDVMRLQKFLCLYWC